MLFKIYRFELELRSLQRRGLLLHNQEGRWSEVSPLEGRNSETIDDALEQLKKIQQGWQGALLPSVEFGLYGLTAPLVTSIDCALLLKGTPDEVLKMAHQPHGCKVAKLKVGHWSSLEAIEVVLALPIHLRLRIDFNHLWDEKSVQELISHIPQERVEFLEDPGCTPSCFSIASDEACHFKPHQIKVWKPMVLGVPKPKEKVILSSSWESSIGLHQIAAVTKSHEIPLHALGIGTGRYLINDIVHNPPFLSGGKLHFPSSWKIKHETLFPC